MATSSNEPGAGAQGATDSPSSPASALSTELREILAFTQEENQKHRDYFEMLYKWTAGSLTILIVAVGGLVAFVGWHTIEDIKKQASAATDQEIRNIRQQSHDALTQQTAQIQQQITKRLDDEFATPAIKQTVELAAKQQTAGALLPIINHEVRSQVSAGVKNEQQNVKATLLQEVHTSVDELRPTINQRVDSTVGQAVSASVRTQVDSQIAPRLRELESNAQLSTLINGALSGDGDAFDNLVGMAGSSLTPGADRELALKVVGSTIAKANTGFRATRNFSEPKTDAEKVTLLNDPNLFIRLAAVDSLSSAYWKAHLGNLCTSSTFTA